MFKKEIEELRAALALIAKRIHHLYEMNGAKIDTSNALLERNCELLEDIRDILHELSERNR